MRILLLATAAAAMTTVNPAHVDQTSPATRPAAVLAGAAAPGASEAKAPGASRDDGVAGASASDAWMSEAFAHLEALEYHASCATRGLQAPNRAQDLRTFFRDDHIEVVPRRGGEAPAWRFRWRTERWGRQEHWTAVETAPPVAEGARVSYRSPGLVEWYENRPEGIEQGFNVERRPSGGGPLRIEGAIGADLRAERVGDAIDFYDPNDVHVLHYGALHVWDAGGRELEARFEVLADGVAATGPRVAIVVDDGDATYPLTIDPVLTFPSWTGTGDAEDDNYGWAVATAGDVDGDGYSDVLVGAPRYDGGLTDQGAVFLHHGSAAGLSSTPSWTGLGEQALEQYGWSVQTAGDVDGDGFDDVIVGAIYHQETLTQQGRAHLYHGSPGGLSATPAWTVDGESADARLGNAVGTAGDVNGDGFDDVIVGSMGFEDGELQEGRAYLYYGSAAGLSSSATWTVDGNQTDALLGYRVGTAGDVNGDGYDDLFVTADRYDNGQTDEGKAWVYHGSPSGPGTTPNWTAEGNQVEAYFGIGAGTAGDVNGDGYADLIVGAPYHDDRGTAYIYTGSQAGLASTPFWTSDGQVLDSQYGFSVGTAGDINGDGFSDVIVGSPGYVNSTGRARVWRGSASGMVLDSATNRNDTGSRFGHAVATAGDVDGDGFSDVIVGAWRSDAGGTEHGAAFVYRGNPVGLSVSAAWTAESNQEEARLGYTVSGAGDVNGDGYSDVIVGAPYYDADFGLAGAAFAYLGSPSGLTSLPAWVTTGAGVQASHGYSVSGAGDVNGDGFDDVIVGAPLHDHGNGVRGAAFVYHGSLAGLSETPDWEAGAELDDGRFGAAVSGAGDVNGDGFADVVTGAPLYSGGQQREGAAYVFLGSPSGLEPAPIWSTESNQPDGDLGFSVAGAGDVNGDGFGDVVVGSRFFSGGQHEEGAAFVYHGSPSGPSLFPNWSAEGDQVGARLGNSVSTAGDVNGDGYSDLIVGAPSFTSLVFQEGRALVYFGSPSGLNATSNWIAGTNQTSAHLGWSVSTAGDVDGDGYSDVVIGAPFWDSDASDQGRAYLFHGSPSGLTPSAFPDRVLEGQQMDNANFGWAVASAGDVNGDGFSDVVIGEHGYSGSQTHEGAAHLYYGNGGDGRPLVPQQRRTDDSAPIALGGLSDSPSSFLVASVGRSPGGRAKVKMEVEVKPAGVPFDGTGTLMTELFDTHVGGVTLVQLVTGLAPDAAYRWRLRIVRDSPFFPRSPWFSPQGNAPTELDLRTPAGAASVASPNTSAPAIRLTPARPNPFRSSTSLSFEIGEPGHGRVAIYDVAGRLVALLADRRFAPGRHDVTWDGRAASGAQVANGIYFARFTFEGTITTRSVVLVR